MDASIIERFGVLGILVVGVVWAAKWMAAKVVEPLVDSHTGLIRQLQASDEQHAKILDKQAAAIERQSSTLDTIAVTQKEMVEILKREKEQK